VAHAPTTRDAHAARERARAERCERRSMRAHSRVLRRPPQGRRKRVLYNICFL
jgi:hypothetical protein